MLSWAAPPAVKANEEFVVELKARSEGTLRGASMQLRYDPKQFEVVAVEDGGFFGAVGGAAVFTPRIDPGMGVVFATAGASGAEGIAGEGALLKLRLKSLKPGAGTLQVANIVGVDQSNRRVSIQGSAPLEIRTEP
jgi:general secretion pathway protein D